MEQQQVVRVNRPELQRAVLAVVDDVRTVVEGPEAGEHLHRFGLLGEHLRLLQVIEQCQRRGEVRVCDLLVYDWVTLPLMQVREGVPYWYLTVSLNADFPQNRRKQEMGAARG